MVEEVKNKVRRSHWHTEYWTGSFLFSVHQRADLAVAPLTSKFCRLSILVDQNGADNEKEVYLGIFVLVNYAREKQIDFTKPFLSLGIAILFKLPKPEKPGLFSFLSPLSLEIWVNTNESIHSLTADHPNRSILSLLSSRSASFSCSSLGVPRMNGAIRIHATRSTIISRIALRSVIPSGSPSAHWCNKVRRRRSQSGVHRNVVLSIKARMLVLRPYQRGWSRVFGGFSPWYWFPPTRLTWVPSRSQLWTVDEDRRAVCFSCFSHRRKAGQSDRKCRRSREANENQVRRPRWRFNRAVLSSKCTSQWWWDLSLSSLVSLRSQASRPTKRCGSTCRTTRMSSWRRTKTESIEWSPNPTHFWWNLHPSSLRCNVNVIWRKSADCWIIKVMALDSRKVRWERHRPRTQLFVFIVLGSPYRERFSEMILDLQEKGIVSRIGGEGKWRCSRFQIQKSYNKWWKGKGSCPSEKKDSKANPLGVTNVGGIFVVLLGKDDETSPRSLLHGA